MAARRTPDEVTRAATESLRQAFTRDGRVTLRSTPRRVLPGLLAGLVMSIVPVMLVAIDLTGERGSLSALGVVGIVLLVLLVPLIVLALRNLVTGRPTMTLDRVGISVNGGQTIPWADVLEVRAVGDQVVGYLHPDRLPVAVHGIPGAVGAFHRADRARRIRYFRRRGMERTGRTMLPLPSTSAAPAASIAQFAAELIAGARG